MSVTKVEKLQCDPIFDIFYFMEINQSKRMDQDVLEQLEELWKDWKDKVRAYKLTPSFSKNDEGFLLVFLDEEVEKAVDEQMAREDTDTLAFHNLAITLVMSAAAVIIPEIAEGGCAPLPKPAAEVQDAAEELGFLWLEEGEANRRYAVFTHHPYVGGCESCSQCDTCQLSTYSIGE
jgi:hypothetical protein